MFPRNRGRPRVSLHTPTTPEPSWRHAPVLEMLQKWSLTEAYQRMEEFWEHLSMPLGAGPDGTQFSSNGTAFPTICFIELRRLMSSRRDDTCLFFQVLRNLCGSFRTLSFSFFFRTCKLFEVGAHQIRRSPVALHI